MAARNIPVTSLRPDVEAMLENTGVYVACDSRQPNLICAFISAGGKLYLLQPVKELDPLKFGDTIALGGPFLPTVPHKN